MCIPWCYALCNPNGYRTDHTAPGSAAAGIFMERGPALRGLRGTDHQSFQVGQGGHLWNPSFVLSREHTPTTNGEGPRRRTDLNGTIPAILGEILRSGLVRAISIAP